MRRVPFFVSGYLWTQLSCLPQLIDPSRSPNSHEFMDSPNFVIKV